MRKDSRASVQQAIECPGNELGLQNGFHFNNLADKGNVNMKSNRLHHVTLGTVLLILAIWLATSQLEHERALWLIDEGGPIETLTAVGFLLGALAVLFGPELARRWPAAAILLLFGLRELDFHSRFTTMNLTKSRFYLSAEVPFTEKIIGLCVLLFFLACLYLLAKRYGRTWLRRVLRLDGLSVAVATAFLFLVVAKSMDGLPRKLKPLGITLDDTTKLLATAGEELLEMGAALLLLFCALAARKLIASQAAADGNGERP